MLGHHHGKGSHEFALLSVLSVHRLLVTRPVAYHTRREHCMYVMMYINWQGYGRSISLVGPSPRDLGDKDKDMITFAFTGIAVAPYCSRA